MNIQDVIKKDYCLGCGLCVADVGSAKLVMAENEKGFLVPTPQNGFDGKVDNLKSFCPGTTIVQEEKLRTNQEKFYGPFSNLQTAFAQDEEIRFKGSSGGSLTAILCELLRQGKISGVLQVGAAMEKPTKTVCVFSTTVEQVIANAGSRYAPSSLFETLMEVLDKHDRIAVVGKPCDIAGIKQFLRIYPQYAKKVYCTLSFMCMGLPSQNATRHLLQKLGANEQDIANLKYRGSGWPGEAMATTTQGQTMKCSYKDSWGKILGRDVLFRCKICPDGWGSFADLSAGDAWYLNGNEPSFEERPGRSLLFTRTHLGEHILRDVQDVLNLSPYDIRELSVIQKSQHDRKDRVWAAYLVLKFLGDRLLCFRGLGMWSRALKNSPIKSARMLLGFLKRIPR